MKKEKKKDSHKGFFLENPPLVLFLAYILDLEGSGTCFGYFFLFAIFIMLQKNAFGQKKIKFHARVQKRHFGNFSIFSGELLW